MRPSQGVDWKGLATALVFVLIFLFATGCGRRPVTVGSGEAEFRVPSEYVSNFSYPGLWGLSGGDDDNQSLALVLPELSTDSRNFFGVLHVLSRIDEHRLESAKNRVAHQIAEASGEFAGGQVLNDARLRGFRALPADIEHNPYWYLLRAQPPQLTGSDVIARCVTDTPDRKHWSCELDARGPDFIVQISVPLESMTEWTSIQRRVVALVESWRIEK